MSAEFKSNLGVFLGATERAQKSGLIAAAESYMARVKERLLKGYTSGDFVTGNAAGSVDKSNPEVVADGVQISVGSRQMDPPYPLYWELGHWNIFVAKKGNFFGGYVRIPIWVPTMVEMREELVQIVADEIRAVDGAL